MRRGQVKLEYDAEVDAAYLKLGTRKVAASEEVQPGLIVDFDDDDGVVGVEILRFSRRFRPKPQARRTRNGRRRTALSL